ncbi:MAG: A/G-specific adenine glycosylase [Thermodesulfobacteriota bacterium]
MTQKQRRQLQTLILSWFETNKRDLPWRQNYSPYEVWISEIMGQQTQMERVVDFFERWMRAFPDLEALGRAPEQKVLKCWEGLGYYSRARNIRKCAEIIVKDHHGQLPADRDTLIRLPGIGPYTAAAISSIAFERDEPLVDGNIARLFTRYFNIDSWLREPATVKLLWKKAAQLLPKGRARDFNQALMELGALICTPKKPLCPDCPWSSTCKALAHGLVSKRPATRPGQKIITIEMATGILQHRNRFFIQQRLADDVWGSLWEFPGGRLKKDESPADGVVREFSEETGFLIRVDNKITTTTHHYTRYKVILHCYSCRFSESPSSPLLTAAQDFRWVSCRELDNYAFPAGHRKLIDHLREQALYNC